MKKLNIVFILLIAFGLYAQEEVMSAQDLLNRLSDNAKTNIKNMEAQMQWVQAGTTQKAKVYFKNPQKLRIDFSEPEGQVICTDGYELLVYIPSLNIVLRQNILKKDKTKDEDGNTQIIENPILVNPVGLDHFLKNYAISYHETKSKTKLEDGSEVYQFKLIRWQSSPNGFNRVYLYVQDNGIIRKAEGITAAYQKITLLIDNVKINQEISKTAFEYEPPAHTNTVDDFILNQGDE